MGYKALAWAVEQDVPTTHSFAVLCALARFANDSGVCWPAQSRIASITKQTRQSVNIQIKLLEDTGLVEKINSNGRMKYRLNLLKGVNQDDTPFIEPVIIDDTSVNQNDAHSHPRLQPSKSVIQSTNNQSVIAATEILPDWVPLDDWNAFVDMRQKIRKPLTEKAKKLAIKKLKDLAQNGFRPSDVLQQSVMCSYQGLFPTKDNHATKAQSKSDRLEEIMNKTLEEVNNVEQHRQTNRLEQPIIGIIAPIIQHPK